MYNLCNGLPAEMTNFPQTTQSNLRITVSFKGPVREADRGDIAGELVDVVEDALDEFDDNPVCSITVEHDNAVS